VVQNTEVAQETQPLNKTHPALAAQADGWDASTVSKGSSLKVSWLCPAGHTFVATPSNRIKGSSCPYCAGHAALAGYNDIATTHPDLAGQADGWDPQNYIAGTARKLSWKCALGHTWVATGNSRVSKGSGCPVCSNKKIVSGINDLASKNPDLARQADGWDPSTTAPHSNKKLAWVCLKNSQHRWNESVANRSKGRGCPFCSNHQIMVGFNDLATTNPTVAVEADGWDPRTVVAGNHRRKPWKCSDGHVWQASPVSRARQGSGCPYCAGQRAIKGINDLTTTRPDIAAQADGWDPTEVMAQTNKKLPWICSYGHRWVTRVANRTNGNDCPVCSGNVVLAGFNDLLTTHPGIAAEANGWDPTTVSKGHITKKSWMCSLGHTYRTTVNARCQGRNCPICAGKVVLVGFNDLVNTYPEVAVEADGWDPLAVTAGSAQRKSWLCSNGHSWNAIVSSRTAGSGCPTCAKYGFDPNSDGYLYFLRHELWGLLQIGISNVLDDRLARHRRSGWQVIELRGPMPGDVAYGWEQSILKALTDRNVALSPAHIAGTFSGYTESWIEEDFPAFSLKELMALVHGDEDTDTEH